MTPEKAFYRKKKSFYSTMTGNGFNGVLGTGWIVTAVAGHHGADSVLIETNREEYQFAH
jgi:hypothetical protein